MAQIALINLQLAPFALQGSPPLFEGVESGIILTGIGKGAQAIVHGLGGGFNLILSHRVLFVGVLGDQIAVGQQRLLDGGHRGQIDDAGQLLAGLFVVILQPSQQIGHAVGQRQQHQTGPEQKFVFEGELVPQPDSRVENPFHMRPRYPKRRVHAVMAEYYSSPQHFGQGEGGSCDPLGFLFCCQRNSNENGPPEGDPSVGCLANQLNARKGETQSSRPVTMMM